MTVPSSLPPNDDRSRAEPSSQTAHDREGSPPAAAPFPERPDSLASEKAKIPFTQQETEQLPRASAPYRPLRQAIAELDIDILQELEHFRNWQKQGQALSSPTRLTKAKSPKASPPKPRTSLLEPQDVVEDLELEESGRYLKLLSPLPVLLLWLMSFVGLGMGFWWLLTPGQPNRFNLANNPSSGSKAPADWIQLLPPVRIVVDLANLPLIPASPFEVIPVRDFQFSDDIRPPADYLNQLAMTDALTVPALRTDDFQIGLLDDSLQAMDQLNSQASAIALATKLQELASAATPFPVSIEQPRILPVSTDSLELGPDRGEGTFLVLMAYQGEDSLQKGRQLSNGAFVKNISGQSYVQLATFKQLEYARYMAEALKKQGISTTISQM